MYTDLGWNTNRSLPEQLTSLARGGHALPKPCDICLSRGTPLSHTIERTFLLASTVPLPIVMTVSTHA